MNRVAGSLFLLIVLAALSALSLAQPAPAAAAPDPYKPLLERLQSISEIPLADWRAHDGNLPHGEDPALDDSGWASVKPTEKWTMAARWVRTTFTVPEKLNGYALAGARIDLDARATSTQLIQVAVFVNGSLVSRADEDAQLPVTLVNNAHPGEKYVIAVRVTGAPVETRLYTAKLVVYAASTRPDPALLREEIRSLRPLLAAYANGAAQRAQQLDQAVQAVDLTALDRGDQAAFDASLRRAQAALEPLRPYVKQFTLRLTGNSHIDMAWLWPWTETVEVTRNTFNSATQLMREYPDVTFSMATAQTYEWMEEKYPYLFKDIQQRVKEGRWELVGGMWVEPDLNLPSGESLTRQLLYGKRYFQQKFGVDVKIGWNPDSFGYNWQLPQIYKRAGMDYFVTQKIYWNDTTKFPHKLFWWQAPDGSRLLAYFPHDYANSTDPAKMARDLADYAPSMFKADAGAGNLALSPEMMYLFGIGDHGGGPTRADLDVAVRWQRPDAVYPQIKFGTAIDYFHNLEKHQDALNLPVWKDELYLEYHRGVQTTQAENKRRNREAEVLATNAEKLAAFDSLYGPVYPHAALDAAWKQILFNQFHDILPGSGIAINYVDAARRYQDATNLNSQVANAAFSDIAARVNAPSTGLVVFNSLNWPRTEQVEAEVQFPVPVEWLTATNAAGQQLPVEVLALEKGTNRSRVRLLVRDVPALGYELVQLKPAAHAAKPVSTLAATATTLENEFFRVVVDARSGCITSLFDKRSQAETLAAAVEGPGAPPLVNGKPCGNLLQLFVDKPEKWDAWNVDAGFINQHTDLTTADEVKLVENTPLRAAILVKKHFEGSTFVQRIVLYAGVARVDVQNSIDWHAKHLLLKAAFPLRARSEHATFEIPYGSIERPTTRRTPEEQAKFEVPALQWADLSDATGGLSLLNASKYGYDAKDNVLRLSLLRAPEDPDPNADQGHHDFTYALYPHGGTWRAAQTVNRAWELNYPLLTQPVQPHQGLLAAKMSFVSADAPNIIVTAVKRAEDSADLVVRFYEWEGKSGDVKLTLPAGVVAASDANLLEKPEHALALSADKQTVTVPTKAYEIKTVLLQMKP